jgi:hypothetical protein
MVLYDEVNEGEAVKDGCWILARSGVGRKDRWDQEFCEDDDGSV